MAGQGSQEQGPTHRGSPASDEGEHAHPGRPEIGASSGFLEFLRRFDLAFIRTFMAMAMAEDGARELALELLEGEPPSPEDDDGPAG